MSEVKIKRYNHALTLRTFDAFKRKITGWIPSILKLEIKCFKLLDGVMETKYHKSPFLNHNLQIKLLSSLSKCVTEIDTLVHTHATSLILRF